MPTAWEIDTAVYEEKFKYVGDEDSYPMKVRFRPDGLKMYIMGYATDTVYQYALSVAWDINTAVLEKSKYIGDVSDFVYGLFFKPDGTKMYIVDGYDKKVYQFSLSTPWEIDTIVYEEKFKYVGDEDTDPRALSFKPDGSKMYVMGRQLERIYQYSLSTFWDIDTAVYDNKFKYIGSEADDPRAIFFKPDDGLKMYTVGHTNKKVYQYLLSVAWNVDTAVYTDKFKYLGDEDTVPYGVSFKPDGTKMYMVGGLNDTVYQYDLPVAPPVGQPFALRKRGRYIGGVVR